MSGKRAGFGILLAVFLLGGVAGGGVTYAMTQSAQAASTRAGNGLSRHRLKALQRRLDLDRDQHERVAAILEEDDRDARAISRDIVARCGEPLRAHEAKVDDEIRDVLRPEQKRRFERIVEQRKKRNGAMHPL